ncbi:MAG: DUF3619 family protein [Rubrivivax sp.]
MKTNRQFHDAAALELRFAARVAAGLNAQAAALPHDIAERLRFGREQALAKAREARRLAAAGAPAVVGAARGAALLGAPAPWWQRAASVLPLLLLVVGLFFIRERMAQEQVQAAAEVDAVLLADDLPPSAYSDPGFAEFLKTPEP